MNNVRRNSVAVALSAAAWLIPGVASARNYQIETNANANDGLCSLPEAVTASTTMLAVNGSDDCEAGTGSGSIRGIYSVSGQHVGLERSILTGFTNSGVVMADVAAPGPNLWVYQSTIKRNSTTGDGGGIKIGLNVRTIAPSCHRGPRGSLGAPRSVSLVCG